MQVIDRRADGSTSQSQQALMQFIITWLYLNSYSRSEFSTLMLKIENLKEILLNALHAMLLSTTNYKIQLNANYL